MSSNATTFISYSKEVNSGIRQWPIALSCPCACSFIIAEWSFLEKVTRSSTITISKICNYIHIIACEECNTIYWSFSSHLVDCHKRNLLNVASRNDLSLVAGCQHCCCSDCQKEKSFHNFCELNVNELLLLLVLIVCYVYPNGTYISSPSHSSTVGLKPPPPYSAFGISIISPSITSWLSEFSGSSNCSVTS